MSARRVRGSMGREALLARCGAGWMLVVLGAALVAFAEDPAGAVAKGVDRQTHAGIARLREQLALSDAALAAMAVEQGSAEGVFSRLLSWYEANRAAWEARRGATAGAEKALRGALRRLSVGSPSAAVRAGVPALRAAVAAARGREEALLAGLRGQVEAVLTDVQKAVWATIRANPPSAGPYVYAANITAGQLKALATARTRHARRPCRRMSRRDRCSRRRGVAVGWQPSGISRSTPPIAL